MKGMWYDFFLNSLFKPAEMWAEAFSRESKLYFLLEFGKDVKYAVTNFSGNKVKQRYMTMMGWQHLQIILDYGRFIPVSRVMEEEAPKLFKLLTECDFGNSEHKSHFFFDSGDTRTPYCSTNTRSASGAPTTRTFGN